MTVFPRRQDQFVVYQPFGCSVEQRRGRVDVYGRSLDQGLVSLLWIFLGSMSEESRANRSSNEVVVTAGREDVVFVPEGFEQPTKGERRKCLPVHDS